MNAEKLIKGFRATERAPLEADGMTFYNDPNEHATIAFFDNAWHMESKSKKIYQEGTLGLGISIAGTAEDHGVRESKVVLSMH